MNKQTQAAFLPILHFDPQRKIFAATERQLKQLEATQDPGWASGFLISISIFIPTCLNALSELASHTSFQPTPLLFTNTLFAGIGFVLSLFFAFMWRKANRQRKSTLQEIREQPYFQLKVLSLERTDNTETESAMIGILEQEVADRMISTHA